MSCEKYKDELREAVKLKLKSHSAPTPEIMSETDKELKTLIQEISESYSKPYKTVQNEVYDIFSQEWERRMQQKERRKQASDRQRTFQSIDRRTKAKQRT